MSEVSAYHEAGHVFVAVRAGGRVVSATIDPDWDDGPARYADVQIEWPLDQFTERELNESIVMVALAGPVAEMIYTGDPFHPGLVAEWADDWRTAWEALHHLKDQRKRLAYLERQTQSLYQLLRRDEIWEAIATIADHLLAHETLEQAEIDEILEPWFS
ncbi:MAG: hypothetical protein R3C01_03545 [Planctomycetaceae bacterium]